MFASYVAQLGFPSQPDRCDSQYKPLIGDCKHQIGECFTSVHHGGVDTPQKGDYFPRIMKLAAYLIENGLNSQQFAALLGGVVTRRTIEKWCRGERYPRGPMVLKIEEITHGQVTLADIYRAKEAA